MIYVFEIIYLVNVENYLSTFGYLIIFSAYVLPLIFFAGAYVYGAPIKFFLLDKTDAVNSKSRATILLFSAVVLYLPVLREFGSDIFNPRAIYTATRTGFGIAYFGSIVLCYIFFIYILFRPAGTRIEKIIALLFTMVFGYLHGSKGQIITVILMGLLYYSVVRGVRLKIMAFLIFFSVFSLMGGIVFFSMSTGLEFGDLLLSMTGYSDYSRNAVMLIDADKGFHFGRIFFEDNFFSRIPRAIMPDKPKDFGSFSLALQYFPERFYQDEGAPAFGIGALYADFGIWILVFLSISGFLSGLAAKTLVVRLRRHQRPGDFALLCFFCGIVIIPVGSGYLLPEHLVLALLMNGAFPLMLVRKYKNE